MQNNTSILLAHNLKYKVFFLNSKLFFNNV